MSSVPGFDSVQVRKLQRRMLLINRIYQRKHAVYSSDTGHCGSNTVSSLASQNRLEGPFRSPTKSESLPSDVLQKSIQNGLVKAILNPGSLGFWREVPTFSKRCVVQIWGMNGRHVTEFQTKNSSSRSLDPKSWEVADCSHKVGCKSGGNQFFGRGSKPAFLIALCDCASTVPHAKQRAISTLQRPGPPQERLLLNTPGRTNHPEHYTVRKPPSENSLSQSAGRV